MRAIIFRLSIGIQILIGNQISYGQVSSDSLRTDSIDVITGVANYLDVYNTKWMTIGSQYDFLSSAFGLLISNGFDERPLIHFEDFSENLIFKIRGSTDFIKDYSIGTDFGWKYPIRHLAIISLGFDQYNYSRKEFYHHDFNVTAENFITKLDIALRLKIAYRQHAVTVIAWFCGYLVVGAFNRPRFRLTVFVSEFRQLRLPLHVVGHFTDCFNI
jgi:hypothetical protein